MPLCPGKAHNDNDATPAQSNRPNPDGGKPLSANIIGLHILERLQCEGRRVVTSVITWDGDWFSCYDHENGF